MQQPGLTRAIPMAVLGFLVGALVVIIVRALQSIPLWDAGVGIVFGTLFCAAFFIWGMGAFDPKMNLHGEEAERELERLAQEEPPPDKILFGTVWQLVTLTVLGFIVLMAFAVLSGLTLITTKDPLASMIAVGYFEMELFGQTIQVTQLVVFVIFLIVAFVSLALVAGAIGWLFTFLSRGIKEAETIPLTAKPAPALASAAAAGALPAGAGATVPEAAAEPSKPRFLPNLTPRMVLPDKKLRRGLFGWIAWLALIPVRVIYHFLRPNKDKPSRLDWIIALLGFAILTAILYLFFYYVAIGLIFPTLPALELISLANAVLIALLLWRPKYVLQLNGMIAGLIARVLRAIPGFLQ
jgi:Na+-transporting methylmalonyl-CoA/oxaloacetate decarboxylase gamma subunit